MILSYILIVIGFIIFCLASYMHIKIGEGNRPLGVGLALLLTVIGVGSLFYASIRLDLSPAGKIALLFGTFIVAGFFVLFIKMYSEGFSSFLPKKKSDAIVYGVFLLILIVIFIIALKIAYHFYLTGEPPRIR